MSERTQRPDFSDAGYGQVGCPLMALATFAGFVIAIAIGFFVPHPGEMEGGALVTTAIGSLVVGIGVSIATMSVLERVQRLWGAADAILLIVWLVVPAGIVLVVLLTEPGRQLIGPLNLATGVGVLLMLWSLVSDLLGRSRHR